MLTVCFKAYSRVELRLELQHLSQLTPQSPGCQYVTGSPSFLCLQLVARTCRKWHCAINILTWCVQQAIYRIAGNFRGRKLSRIGEKYDFHGENFRGLLAFAAPKDATPQISRRKLLRIATKPQNLRSFLLRKCSAIRYLPGPSPCHVQEELIRADEGLGIET